jgi:hypothetical protein
MRRSLCTGLAVVGAGLAVAACGPGTRLSADTPDQAVAAALVAAESVPLTATLTGTVHLDTTGLHLPSGGGMGLGSLGAQSLSGTLTQESGARRELDVTAAGQQVSLVQYDGRGYARLGTGPWYETPASRSAAAGVSAAAIRTAVDDLGFRDAGPATVDGHGVEHYHAALTAATLEKLVGDLAGSMGGASSSELRQALSRYGSLLTVSEGAADVYLDAGDGSLVRASVSGTVSLDVGGIASAFAGSSGAAAGAMPDGSLGMSMSLAVTVTGYGSPVTVTEPQGAVSLPPGSGLGGLGGMSSAGGGGGFLLLGGL